MWSADSPVSRFSADSIQTMTVLRISFLSGFALELIESLSVALVAVSVRLRLIDRSLGLAVGLFVLLLAPEAFLPFRQVGVNFHAAADGVAAAEDILEILDAARAVTPEAEVHGGQARSLIPSELRFSEVSGLRPMIVGPGQRGRDRERRCLRAQSPAM